MPRGRARLCVIAGAAVSAGWPRAAGLQVETDPAKVDGIGNVREFVRYQDLDLQWNEAAEKLKRFQKRGKSWNEELESGHSRHTVHHALQVLPIVVVFCLGAAKWWEMRANVGPMHLRQSLEVICSVVVFMVAGPCLVLVNKHIIRDHQFHFPILLASLGVFFNMTVTRAAVACGARKLETESVSWRHYFRVIVPICIFNFSTQVLGMWAYLFVPVPEIQILKSVTVVLTLCIAKCVVGEKTSPLLVCGIFVITAGAATAAVCTSGCGMVGVGGGGQVVGVLLCIGASGFEAAKTVLSQVLMDKMNVFDGLYWSCPPFAAIALVFICAMELRHLVHTHFTWALVGVLVANALLTGLTVLSNFWLVKLVGALSLKVLTQARTLGLILLAVFFFRETCTDLQYVGYTVTLVGIGVFNDAKQRLIAKAGK